MDTNLLAFETSSSQGSVALLVKRGGRVTVHVREQTGEHAERLLPLVDVLLEEGGLRRTQLDTVVFGQGPGGFTGLRVACGLAQGIAYALGLRVIPIDSLLAVAAMDAGLGTGRLPRGDAITVVVQDARMGEVYLGAYRSPAPGASGQRSWETLQAPLLMDAEDVGNWLWQSQSLWAPDHNARPAVRLVGDALAAYPALCALGSDGGPDALEGRVTLGGALRASAATLTELGLQAWCRGESIAPESAAPLYVRDKVAYTVRERAEGKGGNPRVHVPVTIDRMAEADLDEVANIESTVQSFPWSRRNFMEGIKAGYSAWVARRAGRVVGFCMQMFAPDLAHLLLIGVHPDEQNKGIGGRLLAHCEHEARARKIPAMLLEVRPSNRNALGFYERRGYVTANVRKAYYPSAGGQREDAWVMQKQFTGLGGAT